MLWVLKEIMGLLLEMKFGCSKSPEMALHHECRSRYPRPRPAFPLPGEPFPKFQSAALPPLWRSASLPTLTTPPRLGRPSVVLRPVQAESWSRKTRDENSAVRV